jgi:hypothetical protein
LPGAAAGPADRLRRRGALILILAVVAAGARAGVPSDSDPSTSEKEVYERELIARALDRLDLVRVADPGDEVIDRIEVVRFPIVEPSDPWPEFLNLFHVVTREHIVRQELLFAAGEAYDPDRVRESARNLRGLPSLFATVRIVAARPEDGGPLVMVVITKDLWSIRLNSNGNFGGGQFNYFYVTPSEQNLLGLNQQLSLHFYLDRDVQAVGQIYRVPRLFGTRLALSEAAALRINHHSGEVEGGWGHLQLSRPLYSLDARWGFWVQLAFDLGIDRYYQGAGARLLEVTAGQAVYRLPEMYRHERYDFSAGLQRSFGRHYKTNLSLGYRLRAHSYSLTDGFALLPAGVRQAFEQAALPKADRAGSLTAGVRFFEARYQRMHNVQTLGLTEDFRLGPSLALDIDWASQAFGFAQESLRLDLSLSYRLAFGDDLLSLAAQAGARYMPNHGLEGVDSDWVDQRYELQIENVSPSLWGIGRLLVRLRYAYLQHSRSRSRFSLGGDSTLRGFVSGFAVGQRLLNVNVEFRSAPWVIYTLHLGFVLFYDGGDAYGFEPDDDFSYHQAVGLGLRGLFPQFDRGTLRIDVGIPLGGDFHDRVIEWVSIAYQQAF